ncbi:hypothetical protein BDZ89DRAFT_1069434 [Hymenopellis radicata]|nr:hypothetical protein BDZ89DRAFT_1069434 [Hymenopellis radicata]
MELKTQLGKRIDNAMFIYKGHPDLKSIPIGDILEATLCCTLPRQPDKSLSYSAFPHIELASKGWKPTKLKDLFYWGYDNSDPKNKGVRVKYSIFNVIFQSDRQVSEYGEEGFPDVGGLRDERVRALPSSKTVNDSIDLGIVILVAGRFIITRNVGSVKTQREFRIMTQR